MSQEPEIEITEAALAALLENEGRGTGSYPTGSLRIEFVTPLHGGKDKCPSRA